MIIFVHILYSRSLMKKLLLFGVTLGAAISLAACGNQSSATDSSSSSTVKTTQATKHSSHQKKAASADTNSKTSASSKSSSTSSATSQASSTTNQSTTSTSNQQLTDNQLAVLIYRASGYTNLTKLIRGSAPQGRQAIGGGTAASTVYYTVNGNQVTIYTLQDQTGKTTAEQDFAKTTTTIDQLKSQYYHTASQQDTINQAANEVTIY